MQSYQMVSLLKAQCIYQSLKLVMSPSLYAYSADVPLFGGLALLALGTLRSAQDQA